MLYILLLFLILFAGIMFGSVLTEHQGYVLIQIDNYNIETSITSIVIMLVLLLAILLIIEWILKRIFNIILYTQNWFIKYRHHYAKKEHKLH
ncbi:heme biosynthesis HemY N-terminal domain-containing protein [Candidatus Fukatsuia anoeciicola]|uniref:heme biosynthesis HemY N-terminal domain-containing protein n=1 Tax=Candidatus Fukatsuia anoeciicola TaxID=2994492 RepID=UPI00346484A8